MKNFLTALFALSFASTLHAEDKLLGNLSASVRTFKISAEECVKSLEKIVGQPISRYECFVPTSEKTSEDVPALSESFRFAPVMVRNGETVTVKSNGYTISINELSTDDTRGLKFYVDLIISRLPKKEIELVVVKAKKD